MASNIPENLDYNKHIATLSNSPKRVDQFYVEFLKFFENESNILGRYTKMVTRPTIDTVTSNYRHKRNQYKDKANIILSPINVTFVDDENSLVSCIVYTQLLRQQNKHRDLFGRTEFSPENDRDYKFDIRIKLYNSKGEMTEGYIYKNCFLTNIEHSNAIYSSSEENEINIKIDFDDIEFLHIDKYLDIINNNFTFS